MLAVFCAFLERKAFRRLKGVIRMQAWIRADSVTKQALVTLCYLHSWSKMQAEIKARRVHMVNEGRLRQKKLQNQLKLSQSSMIWRWIGVAGQKQWRKFLEGYIRAFTHQVCLSGSISLR